MNWFKKRPAVPERPPMDPALLRTVDRITQRALAALERGDELLASEWMRALFSTDLRRIAP